MIAVAGFNTSIDKLLRVEDLVPGTVLRAHETEAWPGGKGVHVALAAGVLGEEVRLAGLVDRAQHAWFQSWLRERCVDFHGIEFDGPVRTCLTIHDRQGRTTEIREPGPSIDGVLWRAALAAFERMCVAPTAAVLSGSVPPGVPATAYRELVTTLSPLLVAVDAAGDLLRHALDARPFCVKPNREEAQVLTGTTIDSIQAAARAVRTIAESGVRLVVVSLGDRGAVAAWDGRVCHVAAPSVVAANVVGAGDCVTAGIAVGLARGLPMTDTVRLGVACGTAKVLSPEIGLLRRPDIDRILPDVHLSWLD